MRRRLAFLLLAGVFIGGACSGSSDKSSASSSTTERPDGPRFCDAYLDYIGDSSDGNLDVVVEVRPDDAAVAEAANVIRTDSDVLAVLAATETLDDHARELCQSEWIGAAQGAGSTAGAAEALFDAAVNGDRIGAANVASANAIARFEPWEPIEADVDLGTPKLVEVGSDTFSMILDLDTIVQCRVSTGVVINCQRLS